MAKKVKIPMPAVVWMPVADSHSIESAGYDEPTKEMQVRYKDGTIYRFGNVPQRIYEGFVASSTPNTYLRRRVLNAFPHIRVPPPPTIEGTAEDVTPGKVYREAAE